MKQSVSYTHCELIVERGQIVFAALRRRSQPLKHGPTALTGSGQRKIYRQTGTSVRVAKCHEYDGYIRVKISRGWGKKSDRIHNMTKLGLF